MDIIFATFLFFVLICVSLFGCFLFGCFLIGHSTGTIIYSRWQIDILNGIVIRIWVFLTWITAQIVSTYAFYSAYLNLHL